MQDGSFGRTTARGCRLGFLALLGLAACHLDVQDPGTHPPVDLFYFPAGVAVDPEQPYLYVSNGNADLRYGGATIQVIDTRRFDCAVERFRFPDRDLSTRPACAHVADDVKQCVQDPVDPSIVNCKESPFILANSAVEVGNFAGAIQVQTRPGTGKRRLFVGVRGDPSVTWIDVDLDRDTGKPGVLDCFDDPNLPLTQSGYDPVTNTTARAPGCAPSHRIQTYKCSGLPSCTQEQNNLPSEPFALVLDENSTATPAYQRLVVSHLSAGQVSVIDISGVPTVQAVSTPFFTADTNGRRGAFSLAPVSAGDPGSLWYLTSNLQATVATFRIATSNAIVPGPAFSIGNYFPLGNDVRSILFASGGERAFLTQNNPPSVLVLDTRPSLPAVPGVPANRIVDIISTCQTPSQLSLRSQFVLGIAPRVQERLYAVCFLSNQVMVVDPDTHGVLDTIIVGSGPNQIAFAAPSVDQPTARGYVSQFGEWTVGVVDLEPGSPTENRLVARIGLPRTMVTR